MNKKTSKKSENGKKEKEKPEVVSTVCNDKKCPTHGNLKARGRIFEGRITKKFKGRILIEFERMIYSRKYERYFRARTRIHAHLPTCMESKIQIGDLIKIQECRPLSKIIHFVVIQKIKGVGER